jgi:hypothetical protein
LIGVAPLQRDQKANPSQIGVNRDFRDFAIFYFYCRSPLCKLARLRHSGAAKISIVCRRRRKFARLSTSEKGLVASTKCGRNRDRVPVVTLAAGN